ncbi:MAG TPA: magnesium transporter CorA family protein [Methylomirabilota bacterium]|nr:magnesium transporter CorA family protein [Methylomirabilota bacterium]
MATPTQASSSDETDRNTGRAGEPVARRRHVPAGDHGPGTVRVYAMVDGKLEELEGTPAETRLPELIKPAGAAVWVDLTGPSNEQVEAIGPLLGLHPLIVEDILEGNQRSKLEITDGVVHLVLFSLEYSEALVTTEIDIVLGAGFLLTAHDRSWDPRVSHHLRGGDGVESILAEGPDHLLWAICDDIVDRYFPSADLLGDAIDDVQDAVVRKASPDALDRLFALKRELHEVRRSVGPVREIFNQLTNREMPLIDPEEIVYFRDVYDHIIRLTDELDNYRELAAATLDVYLTQVNNNLSVIMKRLTGVTVIVAGVGAVAGIFGMSEAGTALAGAEASGFWVVTGITVVAGAISAVVLRRIGWI